MKNQSSKNSNYNQTTHVIKQDISKESKSNGVSWLSVIVSTFALLTTILLVLGYGYQRGFAERFHLEVSDIANSTTDFLLVAPDALAFIFTKMIENFSIISLWKSAYIQSIIIAIVSLIALFVLRLVYKRDKTASITNTFRDKWLKWLTKLAWLQYLLMLLISLSILPISTIILYVIIVIALAIPFMIVIPFGYYPGQHNADEYIINPTNCAPLISESVAPKKTQDANVKIKPIIYAACVAVSKDGVEIARGRRIAIHAERIFIYIKKSHSIKSLPISDATIELVDSEDTLSTIKK